METLYYNGRILTMAHQNAEDELVCMPEAVLIRDGVIAAVGSLAKLSGNLSCRAKRVDLMGRCLMPGFIDSHSHAALNGQMALLADLSGCNSFQEIIDALKVYIAERKIKPGQAVMGFGYDHNFLAESAQPDRRVLDQVSSVHPIMVMHVSAHLACVNSAALAMAGITSDTEDPQGGVIGRLPGSSEPSGYLEEAAMHLVQPHVTKRMKIDILKMLNGVQDVYVRHGITTIQDGATTQKDMSLLRMLALLRRLKVDVVAYPMMSAGGKKIMDATPKMQGRYHHRLKIGGYKLVLDGSPQGRSAWMSEPYLNGPEDYRGYPWMTDEQVEAYVKQAVAENKQLLAHCNGDAASEQYLNAYEKALKETGCKSDLRPVMIHCQTVRNDQLDRMSAIKMIASIFVGHVWYWGDVHVRNFGLERGSHISPMRDALDRGIHVNVHQDTPVTKPDMMHSVWCAVNRISRSGRIIGEAQCVSVYEALQAVTIGGAYQYFEESSKGSIEAGKRADLVILDRCPLDVEPEELNKITVHETIKDGKCIYRKAYTPA